jgi:uncharacterized protein YbcI
MAGTPQQATSALTLVSNAMVALHKEHFGRGPTKVRSNFAGPDGLICVLEDALLPAERKMAAMGEAQRVRDTRHAFQAATAAEFISAVEQIVNRKVRAFGSAFDVEENVVFENFAFEPGSRADGNGAPTSERVHEPPGDDGQLGV